MSPGQRESEGVNYWSWVCLWLIDSSLSGISRSNIGINDIKWEMSPKARTKPLVSVRPCLHRVKKINEPIDDIVSMSPIEGIAGKPLGAQSNGGHNR